MGVSVPEMSDVKGWQWNADANRSGRSELNVITQKKTKRSGWWGIRESSSWYGRAQSDWRDPSTPWRSSGSDRTLRSRTWSRRVMNEVEFDVDNNHYIVLTLTTDELLLLLLRIMIFAVGSSQERRPEHQLRMSCCENFLTSSRRSIRMCLYTIVTMRLTTHAWHSRNWAHSQVFIQIAKLIDTGRHDESVLHGHGDLFVLQMSYGYSTGSGILVTDHVSLTNCDGVDYWICEWERPLWTRLKSCGFGDGRATVYCVTWEHGHSVDTIDHIATCLLQTRRKIVSLSDFARDEGTWPTEWLELLGQDRERRSRQILNDMKFLWLEETRRRWVR